MSFDRHAEYRLQLEHLIAMAQLEGCKAHAWRQAKELDAGESGLFRGIAADLRAAMDGQDKTPASGAPSPMKRP